MMRRVRTALVVAALAATGIGVAAAPAEAAHASCSAQGYTAPVVSKWTLILTDPDGTPHGRGHLDIYWSDSRHRVCAMSVSPGGGADTMSVKIKRVGDSGWDDQDSGNFHDFAGGVVSNAGLGSGDCVRIYGDARYSTSSGGNPAGLYKTDVTVHWNHPADLC
jgi:hypothetical protein